MSYLKKFKLSNKLAFILGGEGLIGEEITKALVEAEAKVVVLEKKFKKENLKLKNKKYFYEKFDVSKPEKIEINFKKLIKFYGTPDIFINCSYPKTADWKLNSFKKIKYKSFAENIKIHLNSFSWIAKTAADSMVRAKKSGSKESFLVHQNKIVYLFHSST